VKVAETPQAVLNKLKYQGSQLKLRALTFFQ